VKQIKDLGLNSIVRVKGVDFYIIDKNDNFGIAFLQSRDGQQTKKIDYEAEVEVVAEVQNTIVGEE
jgi:hypothetical protein